MAQGRLSWRIMAIAAVPFAAVVVGILLVGLDRVLTEYQWFASLGQQTVLLARAASACGLWLLGTLAALAFIYPCARAAQRMLDRDDTSTGFAWRSALVLAVFAGLSLARQWPTLRLAFAQVPFGIADPQSGLDVGFFVFTLPTLEILAGWFTTVVVLAIMLVLAIVLAPKRFTGTSTIGRERWHEFKVLIQRLIGLLFLETSLGYGLSILRLSVSSRTQFYGASYTDVHAQLPANWILLVLTGCFSVILLATARSDRFRVPLVSFGVWALLALCLGSAWPALMQQYVAGPNDIALEKPYIARNIAMTRSAFDLSTVQGQQYSVNDSLSADTAAKTRAALEDARIWSPGTVKQAYSQLQTIRPYYRLSTIDTDRYVVNGVSRQVLVSARVIDSSLLPRRAQTWANTHLVYTHGYGMAISAASGATDRGFPIVLVGNIPPEIASDVASGSPMLRTSQPRIYFGPRMADYAIVDTAIDEFDYPLGEKNVTCRYTAGGGIPLGSVFQRLVWALRLGSNEVVLSSYLKPGSRLLFDRDIKRRVTRIAPWLDYDDEPYPALIDGRIIWILDAYTSSSRYPYSQPLANGTNYLRDSVKVTVDALTGETRFYAFGEDPIRDTWAKIFPTVFTPADQISPALAKHFRYPKRMFSAQADVYRMYHMTDPGVFYNKEDQWQIPGEKGSKVKPTYLMVDLPDSKQGRGFYLMQPYAPANRDNMIGWMAASCEPDDYGRQTVYLLPKKRVILGAQQVKARINQDPEISPQLSLWNQRGSKVLFGDMLVLPVEGTIAYVQPIFLQAEKSAVTELASVVVVDGDRLRMDRTLSGALAKAFGPGAVAATAPTDRAAEAATVDALLAEVAAAKHSADFEAYITRLEELQKALDEFLGSTSTQ